MQRRKMTVKDLILRILIVLALGLLVVYFRVFFLGILLGIADIMHQLYVGAGQWAGTGDAIWNYSGLIFQWIWFAVGISAVWTTIFSVHEDSESVFTTLAKLLAIAFQVLSVIWTISDVQVNHGYDASNLVVMAIGILLGQILLLWLYLDSKSISGWVSIPDGIVSLLLLVLGTMGTVNPNSPLSIAIAIAVMAIISVILIFAALFHI